MSSTWKYAQIFLGYNEFNDPLHIIAEVYCLNPEGTYDTFCPASLETIEDLEKAAKDIKRDGTNTWFHDNGEFIYQKLSSNYEWDWIPKKTQTH